VGQALGLGHWVLDPAGAPPLIPNADSLPDPGVDPLTDARRALDFTRDVVERAQLIEYSADSISPTYRADEDPFPAPEDGSGVRRFDVAQPPLPSVSDATGGATPVLPSTASFRKMAVYVKDGHVIRVMEHVGVSERTLDDLRVLMTGIVKASAPPNVLRGFEAEIDRRSGDELAAFLLDGLNSFVELRGDPPIRFRTMTLKLLDLGDDAIRVELPQTQVEGSLALLHSVGRKPVADETTDDAGGASA
jgi:hypothetical protein